MTLLTPQELTTPANKSPSDPAEGLADLSAKSLWRSGTPEAVRKAWNAGGHDATWKDWRGWLGARDSRCPFADLPRRAGPPLGWGAPAELNAEVEASLAPDRVVAWLEREARRENDIRFALECVALADAAPRLAASLDASDWWRLCDILLGVANDAAAAPPHSQPDDAVAEQLLGGELAYALAGALPELKPMHQLRAAGAEALSDGLERLCDGEGLPHADLLPRLGLSHRIQQELAMPQSRPAAVYCLDTPIAELRTAELFGVSTLRLWVAGYVAGPKAMDPETGAPVPGWRDGFAAAGLDESIPAAFDVLFRIVAAGARRKLDIRCPTCRALGEDEGAWLQTISLIQGGCLPEAKAILDDWLQPTSSRMAMVPAKAFALAMADAGLRIPRRHPEAALPSGHYQGRAADQGLALLH